MPNWWLKPALVGQFEFLERTADNHLRHGPVYLAMCRFEYLVTIPRQRPRPFSGTRGARALISGVFAAAFKEAFAAKL
jgi:hypothetical protein